MFNSNSNLRRHRRGEPIAAALCVTLAVCAPGWAQPAVGASASAPSPIVQERAAALATEGSGLARIELTLGKRGELRVTRLGLARGAAGWDASGPEDVLVESAALLPVLEGFDASRRADGRLDVAVGLSGGATRYIQLWHLGVGRGPGADAERGVELRTLALEGRLPEPAEGFEDSRPIAWDLADPQLFEHGGRAYLMGSCLLESEEASDTRRRVFLSELPKDGSAPTSARLVAAGSSPKVSVDGDQVVVAARRPEIATEIRGLAGVAVLASADLTTWTERVGLEEGLRAPRTFELLARAGQCWVAFRPLAGGLELQRHDGIRAGWTAEPIASEPLSKSSRLGLWLVPGARPEARPDVLVEQADRVLVIR